MKKIGLLLGSFDPPHIGHVWAANYALNNGMDAVWVVPAWKNPTKSNQTSFSTRKVMCDLTFIGNDSIVVSGMDGKFQSTYTCEGLEKLLNNVKARQREYKELGYENEFNYEFYIIGGTDITTQVSSWEKGEWILENFKILEVPRLGYANSNLGIECSSSILRNMIQKGESVIPFINFDTLDFINSSKLYDSKHS